MAKHKILILMAEAGGGHSTPAASVQEALEGGAGELQVDVVDFAARVGASRADRVIKDRWNQLLAHPAFTKTSSWLIQNVTGGIPFLDQIVGLRDFAARARSFLRAYGPDIVFTTYHVTGIVAGTLRAAGELEREVVVFCTDPFATNFMWSRAARLCDRTLVASGEARDAMIRDGVPPEKLLVVDYPVREAFTHRGPEREGMHRELHLPAGRPTALVSAGGEGIGRTSRYVAEVYRAGLPLNILAVCGKNREAKEWLETLARGRASETHIVPLGYVRNMHELLQACDFVVGKAGASTFLEALHTGRPIVFTEWAAHNEKPNVDYCLQRRLGWYAPSARKLLTILESILSTPILAEYAANIRALGLRNGSEDIARFLLERLEATGGR